MKQLNLEQKGYLAISIPLIIQIVSVTILVTMLLAQRNNYLHEAKIREVSRLAALTPKALLRCGQACVYVNLANNPEGAKRAFESTTNLKNVASELTEAAAGDDTLSAHTNRISAAINSLIQEFSQYSAEVTRPDRHIGGLDKEGMRHRLNAATDIMLAEAAAISEIESGSNAQEWSQSVHSAELILALVIAGVTLTILNALGTAFFFNRDISRRLDAICQNVSRIGQHKSLLAPIGGNDELTNLDVRFHKMARALDQASAEKKHFTEMLENRLRAPLIEFKAAVAELLSKEAINLTAQGRERLSGANQASQRLVALLSELIDIENLQSGKIVLRRSTNTQAEVIALIEPASLINQAITLLSDMAEEKGCKIKAITADDAPQIDADFERLLRVITNLLANAIKFSHANTQILVGYRTADSNNPNSTDREKSYLTFFVQNQGKIIPAEMKEKIFQRYEQIDQKADTKKQSGTGLGLFICKEIVEAHGGQIWVESTASEGTIFFFTIPN